MLNKKQYTMYGMSCSYFSGKLEGYFRAKGIPYQFVEMTQADFARGSKATGVAQLPQVLVSDGTWLTDTTPIIAKFEEEIETPRLHAQDPAIRFLSLFLEDLFDEWFWRPALYYRWAFKEDSQLMSRVIARTLLRDIPLPLIIRRYFMLARQKAVFLRGDGVTRETAPKIEALYVNSLQTLNEIFRARPFLFGDRPCEADFGLFGPFFRHFFSDPTPGQIMRQQAPYVAQWVTRLWGTRPEDLADQPEITQIPEGLDFFFRIGQKDYLPYLEANAAAFAAKKKRVNFQAQGVGWAVPVAPYRVDCFNKLKHHFGQLQSAEQEIVKQHLGESAVVSLSTAKTAMPISLHSNKVRNRLWR